MRKLICPQCDGEFETDNSKKMYCDRKCMRRALNKKHNRGSQQTSRGISKKSKVIKELGGKCSVCNYDKNLSSLTFHHINPKEKTRPLDSRTFANYKHELVMEEVKKCIVVCRNCHGEIEHPQFNGWKEKW